ncbi:MAG: UvrD-helicase domain-containing protein [Deltaproteobacteria bacterium]|nr:UvrD-helicase domain-containing protein [Deltaproteobacteria bacterium]
MGDDGAEASIAVDALNEPQRQAVAHAHGPVIVFAGAGSGKTRVITYRVANLVATHRVPAYRILGVTFTNKAAQEMKLRLERLLGEGLARELWLGTFHAVCVRLIRRYHENMGLRQNFVIYDDSDQKAVMTRVLKDLKIDERRYPPKKLLARIQREKQECRGPDEMEIDNYFDEMTQRCFVAYQQRLTDANAADFTDLLLHVLRLAEDRRSEAGTHLRSRFSHVLVDEFQDVNQVQYRLVRALGGEEGNICVVGDDDQSIYRWRGADVRNIRGFTHDFPDAKLVKLEQNYRSSGHVVSAALGVIRCAADRQPKELWTDNPEGDRIKVVHAANERDEAAYVVSHIQALIAGGTSPKEIAVFYRVHAQSRVLEDVMRGQDVPYQIVGGHKFFDRSEIKDLLSYLRVIINPQSDVDLVRIINKPARRIGARTIEHLAATAQLEGCSLYGAIEPLCASNRISAGTKRHLRALGKLFEGFMAAAVTGSPRELAEEVIEQSGYGRWLQDQDNAEADARLDNLKELLGSIDEYEEEQAYADEEPTLVDYLTRVSLVADADTMTDVPRVPMMTIHAAKGLEFDHVFLTGMEERLFPVRGQQPGEEEELEEERRLAYVAITRARRELHITHTQTRMIYGQVRYNEPSRFLAEIPAKDQERVATEALRDVAGAQRPSAPRPPWRELIRAGSPMGSQPRPAPPQRPAGERYVERDQDGADDFADGGDGDRGPIGPGTRVRHAKFGVGVIRQLDDGPDPAATVTFSGWGVKRIKVRFLTPA